MTISLFLGAGASVPFGMPTTKQFKKKLLENYPNDDYIRKLLNDKNFVDVEHILGSIDDIENVGKYGSYLLDFVKNHEDDSQIKILSKLDSLKKKIYKHVYDFYGVHNIQNLSVYDWLFNSLRDYGKILNVFTTNYDRVIEEYILSRNDFELHDGFKYENSIDGRLFSIHNFADINEDNKKTLINLHKLHGSLDWKKYNDQIIRTDTDQQLSNEEQNLLIYPTLNPKKGLDVEPFTSISGKFREDLKNTQVLIVIGYSFRDSYINKILRDFLDNDRAMVVISPTATNDINSSDYFGNITSHDLLIMSDIMKEYRVLHHDSDKRRDNELLKWGQRMWKRRTLITIDNYIESSHTVEAFNYIFK